MFADLHNVIIIIDVNSKLHEFLEFIEALGVSVKLFIY